MSSQAIYLDYNAATPCDPEAVEAMLPYFSRQFGNAASKSHPFGWEAAKAVESAREKIAALIGADPQEIIFTSGATESVNLALKGIYEAYSDKGNHVVTVQTEHSAVLDACRRLERSGAAVSYLPVDGRGMIDLEALEAAIRPETILVAAMFANNETGVILPMEAIGEICKNHGVLFFSDATQAVGKIEVFPEKSGIQLMAFSAHKMYGPKGVGALYLRRRLPKLRLIPQIEGGAQEQGLRSGTVNVPGIVGLGKAAEIAIAKMSQEGARLRRLRDHLESALTELEEVFVNGSQQERLPHVSNLAFRHVDDEALIYTFNKKLAVSTGSACHSASLQASHVLEAMGLDESLLSSSLRFSLGRFTTKEEIDFTIQAVKKGVLQLRELSAAWEMFKAGSVKKG